MLAILVGTTVLGCLLVGVIVTLIWYLGERPQVSVIAAAKPPSPSSDAGGSSWNGSGNQPQPVFGPGIFAGNNPRQVAVPTPRGTLPGIDPTEFPGSGTEIGGGAANIQDILDLLPPGFFGPEGPGAGGMPGPAPGSPIPPAAAVLVTLSNLRIDGNRIQVDFDYGNGIGLPFDRYVIRAGDGVTVIRPLGLSRGRGTMTSTLQGVVPPGPVQVWLERRASPQADGERISNILSR